MNLTEQIDYATAHRERICVWLRANDIDPDIVPMDAYVLVRNGVIVFPIYVRGDHGRFFIDHETRSPVRGLRRTELIAEPGETVARWLVHARLEGVNP